MQKLVIFGTGPIAEVAHYYFSEDSDYRVTAFTVDADRQTGDSHMGLPVVAFDSVADRFPPDAFQMFVAMGYGRVNRARAEKVAAARAAGYRLAHYVSSRAWVWKGFVPRENLFLMEHNTIQPFVEIGENATLWSGNHIGHHSRIGDNAFIASHAVVSGNVSVGPFSFIGVNATLRDNIALGRACVVGAGALVLADAPDETVFPGKPTEPARVPSSRLRAI